MLSLLCCPGSPAPFQCIGTVGNQSYSVDFLHCLSLGRELAERERMMGMVVIHQNSAAKERKAIDTLQSPTVSEY